MSVAVMGLGLAVSACGQVQMGAAAIVGNQRITIANLDTEVTNLSQTAKQYPGVINLTATQRTQETLTWLVRFMVNEELARQSGIAISTAQAQAAFDQLYAATKQQAESQGLTHVTPDFILAANGIPPNQRTELGRWEAIELAFIKNTNGGTLPTTTSAQTAASKAYAHAQCVAAKALNILINPQFGQLSYTQLMVVSSPVTVSRPEGPAAAPSLSGLTPAC